MPVQHYEGGCQCGAVRYAVDADLDSTITCNCSRCRRMGFVFTFVPEASFKLLKGDGATTEYRFNREQIRHLFCATCGVESFASGKPPNGNGVMVAVNARCLDGVDATTLSPKAVDGASF